MPFKSKAQMRLIYAKEKAGELPKGTADQWAKETKDIDNLPEKVSSVMEGFFDEMQKIASKIPMSISKTITLGKIPPKRRISQEEIVDHATKPAVTDTIVKRTKNVARAHGQATSEFG